MSKKRAAIEAEILQAAADIFSQRGYQATTLDAIAAAAGISRAAFYYYFPSKDELLRRMYSQVIASSQAAIERIAAENLSAAEKLRRIVRHQVNYLAAHIPLVRVFFSEGFNLPTDTRRFVTEANRAFDRVIEQVLEEGVRTGELVPLHPKRVTFALIGMCNWMYLWYRPSGEWTPDTIAEDFIRLLESGYLVQKEEAGSNGLVHEVRALRREIEDLKASILSPAQAASGRQEKHVTARKRGTVQER